MPVCDVKSFLKVDEADSGDEGDGSRDQGWVTEQAKEALTRRNPESAPNDPLGHRLHSRASLPSICIPSIHLHPIHPP
ncbi:MAG: hypothetical protein QOD93_1403 [Acetobacteraceae bacterium]|nr:hypothetical protein [Acetobacteraceae bacterium]